MIFLSQRSLQIHMLVIDQIIQEHNSQHNIIFQTNELQSGKSTLPYGLPIEQCAALVSSVNGKKPIK